MTNVSISVKEQNKRAEDKREEQELMELLSAEMENFKFRLINPMEVENLTPEALEYLLYLKGSYAITEDSFEEVLTDVSSIFGILDLSSLKDLLNYRGIGNKKIVN